MRISIDKIRNFFISRCCKSDYNSVLKDNGKLELQCSECGKICGVLEEKFTKGNWPNQYD